MSELTKEERKAQKKAMKLKRKAEELADAEAAETKKAKKEKKNKKEKKVVEEEPVVEAKKDKKEKKSKKAKKQEEEAEVEATPVVESKKEKKDKKKKNKKVEEEACETPVKTEKTKKKFTGQWDQWFADNLCTVTGDPYTPCTEFDHLKEYGFPKRLIKGCKSKFANPTAVQASAWPLLAQRKDMCAIAKTGSGKTLGYFLPFLAQSAKGKLTVFQQPSNCPRMVVLAPTRELAQQIEEVVNTFSKLVATEEDPNPYPCVCIVGGVPKYQQINAIQNVGADVVIATPGRLQDLANDGHLDLSHVQILVLDEADRMLDQGFIINVRDLVKMMPKSGKRQTACFSATWPTEMDRLSAGAMSPDRVTIRIGKEGEIDGEDLLKANDDITQIVEVMPNDRNKMRRMMEVLNQHKDQKILIFGLYKKEVAHLENYLLQNGFPKTVALQGDMSQAARTQSIEDFKKDKVNPLVATDVAGRGLDVKGIQLVLNYTFPLTVEDYVHRCGRTGRAGTKGKAITFFNIEGNHKEKEHAFNLIRVLEGSKQKVPQALIELNKTTFCATKKKAHPVYGNFFKDEAEMKALEAKKVHTTFDDSDDE